MAAASKVVDLIIRGKDLTVQAVASTVAGLGRVRSAAVSAYRTMRAQAAAATSVIRQGFQERIGHVLFDTLNQGVRDFFAGAVGAAAGAETTLARLRGTIQGIGLDVAKVTPEITELANRVADSTAWGDDEALEAMDAILRRTRDYRFALNQTALAIDIAAKKDMTAAEAGDLLGKVYQGNSKSVKALGVDATTTEGRMEQLHRMFDGSAVAQLGTYEGKVRDVRDEYGEMQEAAGKKMIPVLAGAMDAFKANKEEIGKFGEGLWTVVRLIGGIVMQAFSSVASLLAGQVAGAIGAVRAGWDALALSVSVAALAWTKAKRAMRMGSDEDVRDAEAAVQRIQQRLAVSTAMVRGAWGMMRGAFNADAFRRVWDLQAAEGEFAKWTPDRAPLDPFDPEAGKDDKKDAERERIDALRSAAEMGILSNANRREALELEERIGARISAGIPDLEKRVDAEQKVRDLRAVLTQDYRNELDALREANELQAATPAMIESAMSSLEQLNATIPAAGRERAEHLRLIAQYHEELRAPMAAELESLSQAAEYRALSVEETARLAHISGELNVLQVMAVGQAKEQAAAMEMQRRVAQLLVANQTREVEALAAARQFRRLTPDEQARHDLRRRELETQIQLNLGTAEELRLRQLLATLDPASGGLTRGERNQGPLGMLDTGVTMAGVGQAMQAALGPVQTLENAIGRGLVDAMYSFGEAAGEVMAAVFDGNAGGWEAFSEIGKQAIANLSRTLGDHYMAMGAAAIAEGIWPPNPALLAKGTGLMAAAALFYGIGGAVGKSGGGARGGGGGGGGLSSNVPTGLWTREKEREKQEAKKEEAKSSTHTIVLKGEGNLNLSDPAVVEQLVGALNEADDRGMTRFVRG